MGRRLDGFLVQKFCMVIGSRELEQRQENDMEQGAPASAARSCPPTCTAMKLHGSGERCVRRRIRSKSLYEEAYRACLCLF
jgi:hypothetical protein